MSESTVGPVARPAGPGAGGVRRRALLTGSGLGAAALLAACQGSPAPTPAISAAPTPSATAGPTVAAVTPEASPSPASPPATGADLSTWSLEQKVGQLLMVGVDATSDGSGATHLVTDLHVGGIFLSGRSSAGAATVRRLVDSLTSLVDTGTTHDSPLMVSTDQEGGEVQVLSGEGFSAIPSGLRQAESSPEELTASATTWGRELADAGVTMNLAPIADLVDLTSPTSNAPIGQWHREYGHDAATVTDYAGAFAAGMDASGVIPVLKHFPGLGRVTRNTDTASGVTDTLTTGADDAAVQIFAALMATGTRAVMVSSAVYGLIDASNPAIFSSAVVTDLLRTGLGFQGVVLTDDVAAAAQVAAWTPGERAVAAVRAGCDIVLASADASVAEAMVDALVKEAGADPAFAARVDESVLRIQSLKQSHAG